MGAGTAGSAVAKALSEAGHEVIAPGETLRRSNGLGGMA
ncbi:MULTISPECIES: hypothetical protein [Thermococcus]